MGGKEQICLNVMKEADTQAEEKLSGYQKAHRSASVVKWGIKIT